MKESDNNISRRRFLKLSTLASATLAVAGCAPKENAEIKGGSKPAGPMTLRTTPTTGDEVSVLGYGCMRLPDRKSVV